MRKRMAGMTGAVLLSVLLAFSGGTPAVAKVLVTETITVPVRGTSYSEAQNPFSTKSAQKMKLKKVKTTVGTYTAKLKLSRAITKKEVANIGAYYGQSGSRSATWGEACYLVDETQKCIGAVDVTVTAGKKKAVATIRSVMDADGDSMPFAFEKNHTYRLVPYAYFVSGKLTCEKNENFWTNQLSFKVK